jgi:FkbM family methyltransferase
MQSSTDPRESKMHVRLAKVCARELLRFRERYFPRTQFSDFPILGQLIPLLLKSARSPVVENVHGHRMFVDEKDSMGLSIDPHFEPLETQLLSEAAKPGFVVADVGANIGYYALIFAKRVGASGKVFAFEPDQDNFRLLSENIRLNGYGNVTLVQAAVSNEKGQLSLYRNEANRMDHRTYDPGEGWAHIPIEAVRLDDYFASGMKVDLIKMDIQGAEPKALAGMSGILSRNPSIKLVTEFWPYGLRRGGSDPADFLAQLTRMGFRFTRIDERSKRIVPTSPQELLATLDENDKWAATNLVCSREP